MKKKYDWFLYWFLYVTSNKDFLEFSKTTKQNKEYLWILRSSWIVICLNGDPRLSWLRFFRCCDYVCFRFLRLSFRVLYLQYHSSVINIHYLCFSNKIMLCMMNAFLSRPVYTRHIRLGNIKNIYSALFCTSQIIIQLISRAPLNTTSKVFGGKGFSLMKFRKCQNLNSLFCEISFLEFQHNWKIQKLKKPFEKCWKIGMLFARQS